MKKALAGLFLLPALAVGQTFPVNNLQINGAVSGNVTGTGNVMLQNSPSMTTPTISGAIVGTPSVTFPAQNINFESGITPVTGITLPVSAAGEAPGSSYLAGGAMTVTDNSSHAGHGHALYGFFTNPIGTGTIGPLNADIGVMISNVKQNFAGAAASGELDGQYNFVRNGGANSDTTAGLFDVANYGIGFNAIFEGVTSAISGSTVTQQTDVQMGVVDTRSNTQYGYVASKFIGTGGIAFLGQQAAGQWQHLMQFVGGTGVLFDMPITAGDVVSIQMFDGIGGSKSFGVVGNTFRFLSSTGTQIFTLDDSGNVATGGNLNTGAVTAGGSVKPVISPGVAWGIDSTGATVTIGNGANAVLAAGNGLLAVEDSVNSQSALYLCSAGSCTLLGGVGPVWVTSTTTPTAGHLSVAFNGSSYAIYNNAGATEVVTVGSIRLKTTP